MFAVLPALAAAFAAIITFIIKHPFVSKMMIFGIFTALILAAVNYMLSLAAPYIIDNEILGLAAYFGLFNALSLYMSILIAGWGVKQVLGFVRTV
jgi:hypothetical protein